MSYIIKLLSKLVSYDTDVLKKSNYVEITKFMKNEAKKFGLKTKIINASAKDKRPRPNLIVDFDAGRKSTILVVTHYDIVPAGEGWKTNPFKLTKKGNRYYGRGSNDDKAAISASFAAIKELLPIKNKCKYNLRLVIACDEEMGGTYGLKRLCRSHRKLLKCKYAIVADAKLHYISIGCCGVVTGFVTIHGREGHAGYPYKVPNVIHNSLSFIKSLTKFKNIRNKVISVFDAPPDVPMKKVYGRFSLTILKAGHKTNMIPGKVVVGFDLRVLPEEKSRRVISKFKLFAQLLAKKHKLKIDISAKPNEGYYISPDCKEIGQFQQAIKKVLGKKLPLCASMGGNDGRHLAAVGIKAIGYSPGGRWPHTVKESISMKELEITKNVIKEACLIE